MDAQKVDMFIMTSGKFFEGHHLGIIRDRMLEAPENKFVNLQMAQFKDPTIVLIISILAGTLGIDRFFIGDTGLGIAKLLTCGGLGVWTIVDWFLIMGVTKDKNLQRFQIALSM